MSLTLNLVALRHNPLNMCSHAWPKPRKNRPQRPRGPGAARATRRHGALVGAGGRGVCHRPHVCRRLSQSLGVFIRDTEMPSSPWGRWHPPSGQAHVPFSGVSQRGGALGLPELAFLICERLWGAALLFGWVTVAVAVVTVLAGCRGWGARAGEAGPARVWGRRPGAA